MQNEDLRRSEEARGAEAERISQRLCELQRRLEILREAADGTSPEKRAPICPSQLLSR